MKKVTIAISSLYGGGAERVSSICANELSRQGCHVSIVVMYREKDEYLVDDGIKIYAVASTKSDYLKKSKINRILSLRRIIRALHTECIISFLPNMQIITWASCIGLRLKRIETVRNNPQKIKFSSKLEKIIWTLILLSANIVLTQNEEQKAMLPKRIQRKSKVIFNPINECFIQDESKKFIAPITSFVAAGRITQQKNYELLINAFNKAKVIKPDIKLDIFGVGDENYFQHLRGMVKKLNCDASISFKGRSNNLSSEYAKYQAYILSSNFEGMPNALAEAMVSRLICISTDCPTGPSELIENGENGYLVSVSNEDELAKTIIDVANLSIQDQERITRNAHNSVLKKCGKEVIIHNLIEILNFD